MSTKIEHISGVILAGGKSRRMGRDKREVKIEGESLLNRVVHSFESLFFDIQIVIAEPFPLVEKFTHSVIKDLIPACGSAGGLYTGLSNATHSHIFAVACDMPFLDRRLIRYLCQTFTSFDVVMVKLASGLQPMHGIYSKNCVPVLKAMITSGNYRLQDITTQEELSVKIIQEQEIKDFDPYFRSFLNVNTPSDLEFAKKLSPSLSSTTTHDEE